MIQRVRANFGQFNFCIYITMHYFRRALFQRYGLQYSSLSLIFFRVTLIGYKTFHSRVKLLFVALIIGGYLGTSKTNSLPGKQRKK